MILAILFGGLSLALVVVALCALAQLAAEERARAELRERIGRLEKGVVFVWRRRPAFDTDTAILELCEP